MICSHIICLDRHNQTQIITQNSLLLNTRSNKSNIIPYHTRPDSNLPQSQQTKTFLSKTSLKSFSKQTSSDSTMINTENKTLHNPRFMIQKSDAKISISQLKKLHQKKNLCAMSLQSSVHEISFESSDDSIIDKLQISQMEEKTPSTEINTENKNSTSIFLPQPIFFLNKLKK